MWGITALPEDCLAKILSFTSPRDVCRLSLEASAFRSAAQFDGVWEQFLPSDYKGLLSRAVHPPPKIPTKKLLYLWLSDHPLILDEGVMSFSIEKCSGRKSFMLAARRLWIIWGDTPAYWRWISLPDTRFPEVAELVRVCWLAIGGQISTGMLSPKTNYAAYFVFKSTPEASGFENQPVEVAVKVTGEIKTEAAENQNHRRTVYLDTEMETAESSEGQYPKVRGDGWMEVELGEYYNDGGGEERELEMSLLEVKDLKWKGGLIVQGIEIRPK